MDGAGPAARRQIAYDLENRPLAVTADGVTTSFAYGPDGERAAKQGSAGLATLFLGNDAELLFSPATPAGQLRPICTRM